MDSDLRELEKQARATLDFQDLQKLQKARDRCGLGAGDAEYLQKYLKLCESFLDGGSELGPAEKKLQKLNEEYKFLVGSKTLRDEIMGDKYAYDGDGWAASAIC